MGKGKRRRNHGNYRTGRRKKMLREMQSWWVILGMLVLLWLLAWPGLQSFRDTVYFDVLLRSGMSLPYLYFAFAHRNRPPRLGRALAVLTALVVWIPMMLNSRRVWMLIILLLTYADLGAALWYRIFRRRCCTVLCVGAVHMGMMLLLGMKMRTDGIRGFPFWFPSLVIAVAAGWICVRLLWSGQVVLKDDRLSERIAVVIATFFVGFSLVWGSCICANYSLDTSSPKRFPAVLVEKDISGGRSTSYYIYVTVQGERLRFEVTQSEYYRADIGDEYIVERYQGFLGEPYHIIRPEEK